MKTIAARLILWVFLMLAPGLSGAQTGDVPKYLDPSVPIEQRIDDLLPRMTVEEKVTQISDDWGSKGVVRLKIPPLLKTEGLHGQSYSTGATIFPQAICMGATFDTDLVAKVGKQTAIEAKAAHINSSWSPVLDVARDVRWGRVEETYGEDPYLVSRMGVSWIEAFQGEGMISVPKHFAGHGEPLGGRDSNDSGLSDRILREIHLPSFRAAVEEAHAGGIMAAYSTWHGVPDNASTDLLQKILRQEWGFDGYVVSDCDALNHFMKKYAIVNTPQEAAMLALTAGVNMECGSIYRQTLPKMAQDGLVTTEQLDALVRPVLRAKFKLGLFEHPGPPDMVWNKLPAYDTPDARALARQVEVEGAVLLKNEKNLLPLSKDIRTIAVIGPDANLCQTGDYTGHAAPNQLVSVLQGIQAHVGASTNVIFAPGCVDPLSMDTSKFDEAVAAAKQADVAIVVVGDNSHPDGPPTTATTGENNDGATLDFPGVQRQLIKAIQATGTPVVLVIVNGKPFTLAWEAANIPAILATWYPGEEGGDATADILFGDQNPSGHLPVTWPRSVGQLPLQYDSFPSGRGYKYYDMPFEPQYRFGFGLSYTKFKYSNLVITPKTDDPGFVTVTADVENVGDRDGDDVVQLYITDLVASVETRTLQLEGFQRVSLKKGEKKTVRFELTPYQLSLLDSRMVRRVEAGIFRVHVGDVSPMPPDGGDDHKLHIRYNDPSEGVSQDFDESKNYAAQFSYSMDAPVSVTAGHPAPVTLTVKNNGNLEDVTEVKLFSGDELDSWSFEIKPGESKAHTFQPTLYAPGSVEVAAVAPFKMVYKMVTVQPAPAHLDFKQVTIQLDNDAMLHFSAQAQNVGSSPYVGNLSLKVDDLVVGKDQPLNLQPGEKQKVSLDYPFAIGGLHKVQINDLPAQQIIVPDGLGLALQNPLIYLKLDDNAGSEAKNEITGNSFSIKGMPSWVAGKSGSALQLANSTMFIDTGDTELYRKSFTLSARVKIDQLGNGGDLALFGGQAPMGAGQDSTGTNLHAGMQNGKLYFGFFGADISGNQTVPVGDWVDLTYTYDAAAEKGSLYINGTLDVESDQKNYTGPLQTIGNCTFMEHGNYAIDDVVVVQNCLSAPMVRALSDQGLESLRSGDYVSKWIPTKSSFNTLEAWADIPTGTHIGAVVETADESGKIIGTSTLELKPGHQIYSLGSLMNGTQMRLRAQLASTTWNSSPVLRAVTIAGSDASEHWTTPADWASGTVSPGLITNYGQASQTASIK